MFKSLSEAKSKVYPWNYEGGNKTNSRFTTSEHTNARYQKLLEEGADLSNGIEMKAEIHSMRGGRTRQRTEPRCSQIQPLPRILNWPWKVIFFWIFWFSSWQPHSFLLLQPAPKAGQRNSFLCGEVQDLQFGCTLLILLARATISPVA